MTTDARLTGTERDTVERARALRAKKFAINSAHASLLLAIIDRLTSRPTEGETQRDLQADTAHHGESATIAAQGIGVGADAEATCGSLPPVGQISAGAPTRNQIARAVYDTDPTINYKTRKPVPWDEIPNDGLGVMPGRKRIAYHIADAILALYPAQAPAGAPTLDGCRFCNGTKGGVAGNENVRNGVLMCDYCDVVFDEAEGLKGRAAPALPAEILEIEKRQQIIAILVGPGASCDMSEDEAAYKADLIFALIKGTK